MIGRCLGALLVGLWLVASACAPLRVELAAAQPRAGSGELLVGAARRDITPIPGYPMGGHSFAGEHAIGNLGRLHARALYFEDPQGQPVVLVSLDVWAVSIGLRDRVVEIVQREHGLAHVGREHVVLAATHTHHSPAANASNHGHNLAGGKVWAFDRALLEFLARNIALTVAQAHASREPARLSLRRPVVADFARNRSLEPFRRNPEAEAVLAENRDLPPCTGSVLTPDPQACRAVDAGIGVLVAEAIHERRLIAAAVFMAAHATAMPNDTVFYQGDVFGLAAGDLERRLEGAGAPVVAIFNGAEGDVSPTWARQSLEDTIRIAGNVVDGVWPAFESWRASAKTDALTIEPFRVRHGLFRLTRQRFVDGDGHERVTPRHGRLGVSILGGAEDGRTGFARTNPEGRRRARPRPESHGHGFKQHSLFQGTDAQLPPEVPLSVIDLGGVVIVTLPGEFTTVQGRRIRDGVARATGVDAGAVLLTGLANEYRSYFTTPEEYARQHYEGGSTLYGTFSGPLMDARLRCLAGDQTDCGEIVYPLARTYAPGPETRTGFWKRPRSRAWLRRMRSRIDAAVGRPNLRRPVLAFDDQPPPWPRARAMAPRAWIEIADGCGWRTLEVAGVPQSDDAHRVLTVVTALERSKWSWEAIWLTPTLAADQTARVRAVGVDGVARCSPVFGAQALALEPGQAPIEDLAQVDAGCRPPPGCG